MEEGKLKILDWDAGDPALNISDPREYKYKGEGYLSTLSHLRLFVSDDGIGFAPAEQAPLWGQGILETFGIEDCRVTTFEDGRFFLTYTAVSSWGYGVGLRETSDWKNYTHHGMIISPSNKDAAIFERKVGGRYVCLHRPSGVIVGGNYIWMAFSDDLKHWGGHRPVARTRPGMWDSARIGAGAAPIYTEQGWLEIYHGADQTSRYCLGALAARSRRALEGAGPLRRADHGTPGGIRAEGLFRQRRLHQRPPRRRRRDHALLRRVRQRHLRGETLPG